MTNKEASNVLRLFANLIEINGLPEERILTFRKAYEQAITELESDKRPQGEWIGKEEYEDYPNKMVCECSECGKMICISHNDFPNFCENCGADMKGGTE